MAAAKQNITNFWSQKKTKRNKTLSFQAGEDAVAWLHWCRAEAHRGLLRGLAFWWPGPEWHGGASLCRQQPPAAAPWQVLERVRSPVRWEQLHRPRQEIDSPEAIGAKEGIHFCVCVNMIFFKMLFVSLSIWCYTGWFPTMSLRWPSVTFQQPFWASPCLWTCCDGCFITLSWEQEVLICRLMQM